MIYLTEEDRALLAEMEKKNTCNSSIERSIP